MAKSSARATTPPTASFDTDPIGALFSALLRSVSGTVCVVAARDPAHGGLASMAAERMTAVSSSPPILLWSLDKRADAIDTLAAADNVTVYMLVTDGRGSPFTEHPVVVECRPFARHDLGDQVIFLADVLSFEGEDAGHAAERPFPRSSPSDTDLKTLCLEVALCRLAGDSIRQTALHLGVSPSTVRYHLAALTGRPSFHAHIRRAKPHLADDETT